MAINARSTVPATVGLLAVVYLHHNLVCLLLILIQIFCHINGERRIAIMVLTGFLTINENFCFLIDSLEVHPDDFGIRRFECLPILALASLELSTARARSALARIWTFEDVPVMRQVNVFCLPVVSKLPAEVKQLLFCHSCVPVGSKCFAVTRAKLAYL